VNSDISRAEWAIVGDPRAGSDIFPASRDRRDTESRLAAVPAVCLRGDHVAAASRGYRVIRLEQLRKYIVAADRGTVVLCGRGLPDDLANKLAAVNDAGTKLALAKRLAMPNKRDPRVPNPRLVVNAP